MIDHYSCSWNAYETRGVDRVPQWRFSSLNAQVAQQIWVGLNAVTFLVIVCEVEEL